MNEQKKLHIVLVSSEDIVDINMRDQLVRHLGSLLQEKKHVELWHEGQIAAGENKASVVFQRIHAADIILLLISIDFISSCFDTIQFARKQGIVRKARVIPIILRPCIWENLFLPSPPLHLPRGGKPVIEWDIRDNAYKNIVQGISTIISHLEASTKLLPGLDPLVPILSPEQFPLRKTFSKEAPPLQEKWNPKGPSSAMKGLEIIPPSSSDGFPEANERFILQRQIVILITFIVILLLAFFIVFIFTHVWYSYIKW